MWHCMGCKVPENVSLVLSLLKTRYNVCQGEAIESLLSFNTAYHTAPNYRSTPCKPPHKAGRLTGWGQAYFPICLSWDMTWWVDIRLNFKWAEVGEQILVSVDYGMIWQHTGVFQGAKGKHTDKSGLYLSQARRRQKSNLELSQIYLSCVCIH